MNIIKKSDVLIISENERKILRNDKILIYLEKIIDVFLNIQKKTIILEDILILRNDKIDIQEYANSIEVESENFYKDKEISEESYLIDIYLVEYSTLNKNKKVYFKDEKTALSFSKSIEIYFEELNQKN